MTSSEPVRIILDVNVIVSAIISPGGIPGQILKQIMDDNSAIRLICSREILAELANVLSYPSVKKYFKRNDREIDELLTDFELVAELHGTAGYLSEIKCRDSDDDKYLILAEAAKPDFLVSGDSDLTDLLHAGTVKIVTPRTFWNIMLHAEQSDTKRLKR
jgi:putative PIN family toxin of toxin-antitoxin system